jgi:hypothetical protein
MIVLMPSLIKLSGSDAQEHQQVEQANKSIGATSSLCIHPSNAPTETGPPRQTNSQNEEKTTSTMNASGRQKKQLNLNTYKYHAMGDVASTIRRYGTTDSYSTEQVSFHVPLYPHNQAL